MAEIDLGNLTLTDFNRYEGLKTEGFMMGYLQEALTEGPVGFVSALTDVVIARFITQTAEATGIDRNELCAAFDGGKALDDAALAKLANAVMAQEPARELAHA